MKIITYNVNGIRSAILKNWLTWVQATDADVICLQEIKASPDQVAELMLLESMGYQARHAPYQGQCLAELRAEAQIQQHGGLGSGGVQGHRTPEAGRQ